MRLTGSSMPTPTKRIEQIVELMESRRIKRVPVVRGRHVVGIISRANLLQALGSLLPEAQPGTVADENIRSLLLAEFKRQGWAHILSYMSIRSY